MGLPVAGKTTLATELAFWSLLIVDELQAH